RARMTTEVTASATADESTSRDAWEGFVKGSWSQGIDVRDFIQRNYTPYDGDASFLAGATDKTQIGRA
ncbi:Formate C-acetyltransferase, partial [human gut metagenome]